MKVKVIDILDERRVVVQAEDNGFIAKWDKDNLKRNESYDVEIDIDDELIWKTNICLSSESDNAVIQKERGCKIVGKLDYNSKDNLSTLKVYNSIVLLDIEGIDEDISSEWVEINCDSIRLSSISL